MQIHDIVLAYHEHFKIMPHFFIVISYICNMKNETL